ncbi:MAG: sigma-70 family RNA polymerase sigma factor [Bacteroidota bacterium]
MAKEPLQPDDPDPDLALWRAYLRGDQDALTELYHKHSPKLVLFCVSLTRNKAQAEDLAQEVFRHLIEKPNEDVYDFPGWLRRLARMRHQSDSRTSTRRKNIREDIKDIFIRHTEIRPQIDAEQLRQLIRRRFSKEDANILFLVEEGYSNQDIADRLGMQEGRLRRKKHYLKNKLAKILGLK